MSCLFKCNAFIPHSALSGNHGGLIPTDSLLLAAKCASDRHVLVSEAFWCAVFETTQIFIGIGPCLSCLRSKGNEIGWLIPEVLQFIKRHGARVYAGNRGIESYPSSSLEVRFASFHGSNVGSVSAHCCCNWAVGFVGVLVCGKSQVSKS